MITLNSISYTYPGESEVALRDISLTLGDATVTALVGPNGSGKTTLMQILGGLMVPTSGSISIDGSQASADDLLTGSIMASSSRDLDDVPATILIQYARLRSTWDEQLFAHYARRFGLPVRSRKTLGKLSAGQAAVVTGAIALASGAPITLLDEIQAPLDVPTRYAFYEEILALAGECMEGKRPQRRFLVSSHMVSELEKVAEDVREWVASSASPTALARRSTTISRVGPSSRLAMTARSGWAARKRSTSAAWPVSAQTRQVKSSTLS